MKPLTKLLTVAALITLPSLGLAQGAAGDTTPTNEDIGFILTTFMFLFAGVLVVLAVPLLDRLQIDDVVGAIPVHLFAGIWGTIAVVFTNDAASLMGQLFSIVVVGGFVVVASAALWLLLKVTMGIRVSKEAEINGLDMTELGMEAYPEFSKG